MIVANMICNGIHHLRKWNLPAETSVLTWNPCMYEIALIPISHGIAHANCEYFSPFGKIESMGLPAIMKINARMALVTIVAKDDLSTRGRVGLPCSAISAVNGNMIVMKVAPINPAISEKRVAI